MFSVELWNALCAQLQSDALCAATSTKHLTRIFHKLRVPSLVFMFHRQISLTRKGHHRPGNPANTQRAQEPEQGRDSRAYESLRRSFAKFTYETGGVSRHFAGRRKLAKSYAIITRIHEISGLKPLLHFREPCPKGKLLRKKCFSPSSQQNTAHSHNNRFQNAVHGLTAATTSAADNSPFSKWRT